MEDKNLIINGHEAVDLGLSVKWATCNIGANNPEELGEKYHWGEMDRLLRNQDFMMRRKALLIIQ